MVKTSSEALDASGLGKVETKTQVVKLDLIDKELQELLTLAKPENRPDVYELKMALTKFENDYDISILTSGTPVDFIWFESRGTGYRFTPDGIATAAEALDFQSHQKISGEQFVRAYLHEVRNQLEDKANDNQEALALEKMLLSLIQSVD